MHNFSRFDLPWLVIGPEISQHPLDQSDPKLKCFPGPRTGAGIIGNLNCFSFFWLAVEIKLIFYDTQLKGTQ